MLNINLKSVKIKMGMFAFDICRPLGILIQTLRTQGLKDPVQETDELTHRLCNHGGWLPPDPCLGKASLSNISIQPWALRSP